MPLRLFKKPHRKLLVTVRPDGRFSFNAEASRTLEAAGVKRVRLFGDRKTKEVLVRPAKEDATDVHLVTYIHQGAQVRASIEAAPFLQWIDYQCKETTRFPVTPLPRRAFRFVLIEGLSEADDSVPTEPSNELPTEPSNDLA